MWESLATTPRQDRLLHGAAKALNLVVGFLAAPLWLLGQRLSDPFRRLLARFDAQPVPVPMPQPRERSMDALMSDLEAIPNGLHHSELAMVRKGLADLSTFVLANQREAANLGYAYPGQFSDHVFEGADGERIAASVGLQEGCGRPGLIVVHGLFSSRRFDYVRQIAVRAYYEWGFNVLALDLRSFGLTNLTSEAPTTVGWKEGEDILALARYMKELGSTSVGTLGISLGASSVLGASHPEGAAERLDGGILAVSPPADPELAWQRLAEPVPRGHPRYPLHAGFQAALTSRVRSGRWPAEAEDMSRVMEVVSAPFYGVPAEEIWRRARGMDYMEKVRTPLLILHPEDDQIVKVEHARMLEEASRQNEMVRVWILPAGQHGILEAIDPVWTYGVYRAFFERWATYVERGALPSGSKLVYSASQTG